MKKTCRWFLIILCCFSLFVSNPFETQAKPVQSPNTKTTYLSVATGDHHTCAVTTEGGVKCWGQNYDGELGNGSQHPNYLPADVVGLTSGVQAVSVGYSHSCALTTEGSVKCWGANFDGQLGDGTTEYQRFEPVDVFGLTGDVIDIGCGFHHTCALTENGYVKCWGKNNSGQLGIGTYDSKNTPVLVENLTTDLLMLSVGGGHNCTLTNAGIAQCWGDNTLGQLGDNTNQNRPFPVQISGFSESISSISAGGSHTCAVLENGDAQCWGLNDFGQLGNGNKENQSTPQTVLGLSEPITSIVAGNYAHTCAEMASGNLVCWGFNYFGQLGDGTDIDSLSPVVVSSLKEDVISYDLGVFYSCAVTSQEEASCWGYNNRGQIGQGGTAYTAVPLFSGPGSLRFEIIDLGTKHGCGLRADGTVQCWGSNNFGQLGNGFNGDKFASGSPVDVSNLENTVIDIAAGGEHSCAVIANGEVKCWGENEHGQLGDGNFGYNWAVIPVDVINLNATAEVVVAGNRHTCVLTTAGGVKCWGSNEYGQIGNGSSESFEPTPMDVTGLTSGVIALSAGFDHNCAVTTDGAVKCWGYNTFYQLGDGTQNDRNIPIDVTGLASGITDISAGYDHTCALSNSGTVKCWGASADGSLVPSPQDITDPTLEIINLSAGGTTNVCVVTSSGILQCMGGNQFGEVGNGTFEPTSSFIDVESMTGNVESIVCEVGFCCALVANGRMKCWGNNDSYRLGISDVVYSPVPLEVVEIHLSTNYDIVSSGGYVVVTGTELEPNATVNLYANETFLGDTTTTSSGDLIVFLDTSQASIGQYEISAYYGTREGLAQNEQISFGTAYSTNFTIDSSSQAPVKEGDGLTFFIPENIGILYQFLPLMIR